ncbi:hypothetical protein B0H12DRAFT_821762 [Mycena haematopus]|nr:hypothetical protein B0H12DRAFT_821762 [Mycena haematopus]
MIIWTRGCVDELGRKSPGSRGLVHVGLQAFMIDATCLISLSLCGRLVCAMSLSVSTLFILRAAVDHPAFLFRLRADACAVPMLLLVSRPVFLGRAALVMTLFCSGRGIFSQPIPVSSTEVSCIRANMNRPDYYLTHSRCQCSESSNLVNYPDRGDIRVNAQCSSWDYLRIAGQRLQ